jgi:hypothetical protein
MYSLCRAFLSTNERKIAKLDTHDLLVGFDGHNANYFG